MATKRFSKRAAFMLSSVHVDMLQQLAEADTLSTSDVVRRLIVDAYRARFGDLTKVVAARYVAEAEPVKPRKKATKRK